LLKIDPIEPEIICLKGFSKNEKEINASRTYTPGVDMPRGLNKPNLFMMKQLLVFNPKSRNFKLN